MTKCLSYLRLPREKQPTMTDADASFSLALIHQPSKCGRFLVGGPRGWKGWSAVVYVASSSGSFIFAALQAALLSESCVAPTSEPAFETLAQGAAMKMQDYQSIYALRIGCIRCKFANG